MDSIRPLLLDGASTLENWLDIVLALQLGYGELEQDALYRDVIWRVPYEERVKLLVRLLTETEWIDSYPFLEYLTLVLKMRNILAHMILDVFESTDDTLVFVGRRRGDEKVQQVPMSDLKEARECLHHARTDLQLVRDRLVVERTTDSPSPDPESL